ncbi:MAG: sugar phosphate isomerase/epimerase family protein [Alphaproteobacteria bacterium]
MTMKLSLTSWSLPQCTLKEAAGISKTLGINSLDVGLFYRSSLDKGQLLADPNAVAQSVRQLDIAIPSYYHLFGRNPSERNLASGKDIDRNAADLERVMTFCAAAGIGTVFILPGLINAGQSRGDAMAKSAEALNAMIDVAKDFPTQLTIEAHVHSYLESPTLTLALLERVDGLKLTLDYAHFACLGYRQEEIDVLAPHAAHVHLRQARPGALQTKGNQGTLNMAAQFGTLRDAGYNGALSIEYVHQDYMATLYDDVLSETILMRDLFRTWTAGD